ncbi:hypothetical protein CLCR_07849 [Cladophialophora carrionii]|uniref:Uncharacterized protein n=1 Tax=Cladophialophora carrionii TaxID=86049 RepID=A0A1C1CQF1_9EURO|nr:hypothetical protein CLCR_07849 [Cladophialophora carrionii]
MAGLTHRTSQYEVRVALAQRAAFRAQGTTQPTLRNATQRSATHFLTHCAMMLTFSSDPATDYELCMEYKVMAAY